METMELIVCWLFHRRFWRHTDCLYAAYDTCSKCGAVQNHVSGLQL